MDSVRHSSPEQLEAGLGEILGSPPLQGELKLIVQRPAVDQRNEVEAGRLDTEQGLIGDNWLSRGRPRSADTPPDPDTQLNIMNARVAALVARVPDRWQLAGDQLYVDLDLSDENLPPGTKLTLGTAIIQVTAVPHTGCKKFAQRFGWDAMKFVNTETGRQHNLRGINARVVQSGDIQVGGAIEKLDP